MNVDFHELPAFKLIERMTPDAIETILNSINTSVGQNRAYGDGRISENIECAIGYIRCLLESSNGSSYSAYGHFSLEQVMRARPMRRPLRFIGWAGPRNNIGPAYAIDPACLSSIDSRIFYLDRETNNRLERAERLAEAIAMQSTGIVDVRPEILRELYTLQEYEDGPATGITFRLSEAARKTIMVNGKEMDRYEHGSAIFVLPKDGEFRCRLGEVIGGNTTSCVILARHSYCMK